jgi:hypothetical protein
VHHEGLEVHQEKYTAEALRPQRKEFLIKKPSDLCELGVSAVK